MIAVILQSIDEWSVMMRSDSGNTPYDESSYAKTTSMLTTNVVDLKPIIQVIVEMYLPQLENPFTGNEEALDACMPATLPTETVGHAECSDKQGITITYYENPLNKRCIDYKIRILRQNVEYITPNKHALIEQAERFINAAIESQPQEHYSTKYLKNIKKYFFSCVKNTTDPTEWIHLCLSEAVNLCRQEGETLEIAFNRLKQYAQQSLKTRESLVYIFNQDNKWRADVNSLSEGTFLTQHYTIQQTPPKLNTMQSAESIDALKNDIALLEIHFNQAVPARLFLNPLIPQLLCARKILWTVATVNKVNAGYFSEKTILLTDFVTYLKETCQLTNNQEESIRTALRKGNNSDEINRRNTELHALAGIKLTEENLQLMNIVTENVSFNNNIKTLQDYYRLQYLLGMLTKLCEKIGYDFKIGGSLSKEELKSYRMALYREKSIQNGKILREKELEILCEKEAEILMRINLRQEAKEKLRNMPKVTVPQCTISMADKSNLPSKSYLRIIIREPKTESTETIWKYTTIIDNQTYSFFLKVKNNQWRFIIPITINLVWKNVAKIAAHVALTKGAIQVTTSYTEPNDVFAESLEKIVSRYIQACRLVLQGVNKPSDVVTKTDLAEARKNLTDLGFLSPNTEEFSQATETLEFDHTDSEETSSDSANPELQ